MAEESLITPEIQAMLGQEVYLPGEEVIDKSSIRRYAQAIMDLNPMYWDETRGKESPYGSIIAPPTYIFDVSHNICAEVGEDGRDLSRVTIPGMNPVRGSNEYQFFEPARPGDRVNVKRRIVDIYEKQGRRSGRILFVVYEITYTNQDETVLGICRETMMFLK